MRTTLNRPFSAGYVGLALFLIIAILPIGGALLYAVFYSVGATGLLSTGLTTSYWSATLLSAELWTSFGLSLYVAAVSVALSILIAMAFTRLFHTEFKRGSVRLLFYLPLALPATVAAFIVYQWLSDSGWLFRLIPWFEGGGVVNDPFAIGIILAHMAMVVPFFTLLFASHYDASGITELAALARSLGAGTAKITRRVVVPIILRRSILPVTLVFITVLGSYEIPILLGRQAPEMVSVIIYRKYALFDIADKPEAYIIALMYTALVAGILFFAFKGHRKWGFAESHRSRGA